MLIKILSMKDLTDIQVKQLRKVIIKFVTIVNGINKNIKTIKDPTGLENEIQYLESKRKLIISSVELIKETIEGTVNLDRFKKINALFLTNATKAVKALEVNNLYDISFYVCKGRLDALSILDNEIKNI